MQRDNGEYYADEVKHYVSYAKGKLTFEVEE